MANKFIGRVKKISPTVTIPTKSGTQFMKRELLLDCTRCDAITGEPGRTNILAIEFTQSGCELLNQFAPGDVVVVDFVAEGFEYTAQNGDVRHITTLKGFKIAPYQPTHQQPAAASQPAPVYTAQAPTPAPTARPIQQDAPSGDLPF